MRTKIKGSYVVAFDGQTHKLLKDGEVVFEDDRIVYVGKSYNDPVDETIEAKGRLISPGLINIHGLANLCITHLTQDSSGEGLVVPQTYAVDGIGKVQLEGKELETSATFSIAQILKGGATTVATVMAMAPSRFEGPKDESKTIAETAGKLGIRAYVSYNFRSGIKYRTEEGGTKYHWDEDAGQKGLQNATQFVTTYRDAFDDRVNGYFFPFQLDTCSPDLLQATKAAAHELGVITKLHTAQYLTEFHEIKRRFGKPPIRVLADLEFLDPQTLLIHVIWLTNHFESGYPFRDISELELIAKAGTTVVNCPVIYSRVGQILHSFGLYQQQGINMAIGTDAFPQDMLLEMREAAIMSKIAARTRIGITARDVYNAVTLNSAKALGRNDLGRLAPGAKADITIFDLRSMQMGLIDDPIKSLVYWGTQNIVETVIVDGKIVVENRQLPGIDEESLIKEAREVNQKQKQAFATHNPLNLSLEELFPPSFQVE